MFKSRPPADSTRSRCDYMGKCIFQDCVLIAEDIDLVIEICICDACQVSMFRLHIGDRIVFSGGIPGRIMHELKYLGENAGLRIQGTVGPETILVVTNDYEDNSSTVQKATARNIKVSSTDQFKLQIQKMQENARVIKKTEIRTFASLPISGAKVFPIDLDQHELQKLETVLKSKGASLAQQLRRSIVAGVFNEKSAGKGQCKILIAEGIPIFNIRDI